MPKATKLQDLTPDPRNANRGTDRGRELLKRSLTDLKAGRSILVDKHGVVIAGNKTREAALEVGLKEAIIVPTDGSQLVVVQRTDLDLATDAAAQTLAIADNRIAELSLEWDTEQLAALKAEGADLSGLWNDEELGGLLEVAADELLDNAPPGADDPGLPYQNQFAVAVECGSETEQQEVYDRLTELGYRCKVLTL